MVDIETLGAMNLEKCIFRTELLAVAHDLRAHVLGEYT